MSKLNLTINLTEKVKTIGFIQNDYISKYTNKSQLDIHLDDEKKFFNSQTEQICSINSDTYRFFYFRDTSFKIPKVYISLFFFHPFLRPNITETDKPKLFFQLMLFIAYLKDEIIYELSDAIRAGNEFKIDFTENFIYLDIFCYSDFVEKILKVINKIILNSNTRINNKCKIYRDYALDILNSKGNSPDNELKLEFYKYIYDEIPFYNFYKFPIDEFKNEEIEPDETLNSFIIQGYIYGNFSKEESLKICDLFKIENSTNKLFYIALGKANLNNSNVSVENFLQKIMNRREINVSKTINNTGIVNNKIYFYKKMSTYNYNTSVYAYIIEDIFNDHNNEIFVEPMTQKFIYLKIVCKKSSNCSKTNITETLIKEIKKRGLDKEIDLIGNRFYYYLRNTQHYIISKQETLESASRRKSYENLYDRFNKDEEIDYFDISLEEFLKTLLKLNEMFPNTIIFE